MAREMQQEQETLILAFPNGPHQYRVRWSHARIQIRRVSKMGRQKNSHIGVNLGLCYSETSYCDTMDGFHPGLTLA